VLAINPVRRAAPILQKYNPGLSDWDVVWEATSGSAMLGYWPLYQR